MARRRKSATLFDVIHRGQPVSMAPPSPTRPINPPLAASTKLAGKPTLRARVGLWLLGAADGLRSPAAPPDLEAKPVERPTVLPPAQVTPARPPRKPAEPLMRLVREPEPELAAPASEPDFFDTSDALDGATRPAPRDAGPHEVARPREIAPAKRETSTKLAPVDAAPVTEPAAPRAALSAMDRLRAELREASRGDEDEIEPEPTIAAPSESDAGDVPVITRAPRKRRRRGPSLSVRLARFTYPIRDWTKTKWSNLRDDARAIRREMPRPKLPQYDAVAILSFARRRKAAWATALLVLLMASFGVGRWIRSSSMATAQNDSTARPEVLDVARTTSTDAGPVAPPAQVAPSNPGNANLSAAPVQTSVERAPRSLRDPALNYVIIQSYASEVEAQAVCDLLAERGIDATVEKNLKGFHGTGTTWYAVVGLDGFARLSNNPAYAQYRTKLERISETEVGRTMSKRFDPIAYSWSKR